MSKGGTQKVVRALGALRLVAVVAVVGLLVVTTWPLFGHGEGLPNTRGWGDPGQPGSVQGKQFLNTKIVLVSAGGVRVRVHMSAAANFRGFLNELASTPYPIHQRDTAGYNHRFNVNDPKRLSAHAWGTAVDVNWNANPNRIDCRLVTDLPPHIEAVAERWGLRWGGTFRCPKDPMHFEVKGTPRAAARAARLASRTTRQ